MAGRWRPLEARPMRFLRMMLTLTTVTGLTLAVLTPTMPNVLAQAVTPLVKFAVNGAAQNLDPVTADANPDIWAMMQIYQQLVRVNVKGDEFEPDLAEGWTKSADGKTWTFILRRGIKFSNGDPVRASDVVWSLRRARDTRGPWQT